MTTTTQPQSPPPNVAGASTHATLIGSLAAVYIIWSSTYLGMKEALRSFDPMTLGAVRFLVAGVLMLLLHRLRGGRLPSRAAILHAAPVGALMFLGGNGFVSFAQQGGVTSGVAAIVASTTPLWAAILGPVFGSRPHLSEWLGVLLGTSGVAVLAASAELGGSAGTVAVLLLAPLTWALGSLIARRPGQAEGLAGPAFQMLWGGVGMAIAAPLLGEPLPTDVPATTWLIIAYLVVFGSLIGFTAFSWLLQHTSPGVALSYSYVNPVLAVLLGAALGHEPIHATTLVATAILGAAVAIVVRAAVRRRPRPAQ